MKRERERGPFCACGHRLARHGVGHYRGPLVAPVLVPACFQCECMVPREREPQAKR